MLFGAVLLSFYPRLVPFFTSVTLVPVTCTFMQRDSNWCPRRGRGRPLFLPSTINQKKSINPVWFFRFAISHTCRCVKMADVFALPMNNTKVIVRLFIGKAVHKKIKHLPHEPHEAGVRGVPETAETAVNDLRHPRSRICWCRLS